MNSWIRCRKGPPRTWEKESHSRRRWGEGQGQGGSICS